MHLTNWPAHYIYHFFGSLRVVLDQMPHDPYKQAKDAC